jgi:predicted RNA-binding Zn-ribbon protein involved in translation (DUF1610 family)
MTIITNKNAGGIACGLIRRKAAEEKKRIYNQNPKICQVCKIAIPYEKRTNKYCTRTCAISIINSQSTRKINNKLCLNCNSVIKDPNPKLKHCSIDCHNISKNSLTLQMITDGVCNANRLKKYILKLYGNKCMDPECRWKQDERPINVELDHIDGNSENNTLDNVRLLCPNCHSLTSTYKSRNNGNGRARRRQRYRDGKSY